MKLFRPAFLAAMSLSVAGCAAVRGYPSPPLDPSTFADTLTCSDATEEERKVISECPLTPEAVAAAMRMGDKLSIQDRNHILGSAILLLDVNFADFEQKIVRGVRKYDFGTSVINLGIAAATATVGGEQIKAILGATQTAVLGVESAFNEEILLEQTIQVLTTKMVAERAVVAQRLRSGMASPLVDYPLVAGLSDLGAYYRAGTLAGALSDLSAQVGQEAKEETTKLSTAVSTEAGGTLRLYLDPESDGSLDRARFAQVSACIGENNLAGAGADANQVAKSATSIIFNRDGEFGVSQQVILACLRAKGELDS